MVIDKISAMEILDSRGNPTVQAFVKTSGGFFGVGAVPSGASTGRYEAFELRDKGARYHGKGVLKAVQNIEEKIAPALCGMPIQDQYAIDARMRGIDGTDNKENLGANAILAVSIACMRAAAASAGLEPFMYLGGLSADLLPLPMMNILNGGAHADNNLDIQEFMIVPVGAASFSEGLRMCAEIYHTLSLQLHAQKLSTSVGDEGGFAPNLRSHEEAIEQILDACEKSGYKSGEDVKLALDAASSEWYDGDIYTMPKSGESFTKEELIGYWEDLVKKYPIVSIEDPAAENDWETWQKISRRIKTQIVGDDLFVTNPVRLENGISQKAANAILIKPNQIGTVSEAMDAIKLAKSAGMGTIVSHRSGETEDAFIADFAVGLSAGQIKTGAPCRSERTAKYNRLLYIEKILRNNV